MTIGNRISELRKKYSYSQEYVASKLGVSRQAVSKWETDQTAPDTYNIIALAELLNVSVEYLAIGKVDEKSTVEENYAVSNSRKIVGYILIGVGLLTGILGLVLFKELLYLAAVLIIAGVLCITVKKHFVITTICVFALLFGLLGSYLTGYAAAAATVFNTLLLVFLIIVIVKVIKKVLQK